MNKKFIFKYEPQSSVKRMFAHLEETIRTGREYIQPKNVSITNDLAIINRILSKTRLELFSVLRTKQPNNIHELAQLLHRDYANVWRDCQVLVNCGIIELKKTNQETRPLALYDQIVISYPEKLDGHLKIKVDSETEKQLAKQVQNRSHLHWLRSWCSSDYFEN